MKKIKFSHKYNKMPWDVYDHYSKPEATLLEVFVVKRNDLSYSFVEYDTSYIERDYSTSDAFMLNKNYKLPNGKLLVILLHSYTSSGMKLWTTIRRWTHEKEIYYKSIRGENVEIVIEEKEM